VENPRPYADLPKTKNDRPRRVPLSPRGSGVASREKLQGWPQTGRVLPIAISAFR